jgi:inhibitor of KinA sporulation pathway (predicted exonuclease)
VRPRFNPILSPYLINLTGITNEELRERGIDFAKAYRDFLAFAEGLPILAYGRDDLVLLRNFRLYGMTDAPPLPRYVDVVPWFGMQGIDIRGLHACDAGPSAGVPFTGHKHNGLDDALSVAAGIRALIARGAPAPKAA